MALICRTLLYPKTFKYIDKREQTFNKDFRQLHKMLSNNIQYSVALSLELLTRNPRTAGGLRQKNKMLVDLPQGICLSWLVTYLQRILRQCHQSLTKKRKKGKINNNFSLVVKLNGSISPSAHFFAKLGVIDKK